MVFNLIMLIVEWFVCKIMSWRGEDHCFAFLCFKFPFRTPGGNRLPDIPMYLSNCSCYRLKAS